MQRTDTTQSLRPTSDYSVFDIAFLPAHITKPAELSFEQYFHYPPATIAAVFQYRPSYTNSLHSSSQNTWSTTQYPGDCDFFEHASGSSSTNMVLKFYTIGNLPPLYQSPSPEHWSPAVSQQYLYQEAIWRKPDLTHLNHLHVENLMSLDETLDQQIDAPIITMKGCSCSTIEPKSMSLEVPPTTPELINSVVLDRSLSPASDEPYGSCSDVGKVPRSPHPGKREDDTGVGAGEPKRADGPCAQLIYQALMSREDHAMTVQEIYQWFRENTVKTDPKQKGWQNTVRHNLSMNQAFIKRETEDATHSGPMTDVETPKLPVEWVLADWAVRDGVRSTSRYRPKKGSDQNPKDSRCCTRGRWPAARWISSPRRGLTASRARTGGREKTHRIPLPSIIDGSW